LPAHLSTAEAVIRDVHGTESFFQHKKKEKAVRQWRSYAEYLSKAVAVTEDMRRTD